MLLRALKHRFTVRGVEVPAGARIYYLDLGTHRRAAELKHVVDKVFPLMGVPWTAVGFEASQELAEEARRRLGERPLTIVQAAVCHHPPAGGTVRLFTTQGGLGNSLYREGYDYEEVPAIRLSSWLAEHGLDLDQHIVLVRMNIEGAEREVIADLAEAGLLAYVDGWFGMWDDLAKIDLDADAAFRSELARYCIAPVTFNGRDLHHPFRLRVVDGEIRTAVLRGARRLRLHTG
jgi:FkbM family methyltransferase